MTISSICMAATVAIALSNNPGVERIFRAPSYERGNAGMTVRYDIEKASWLTHPDYVNRPGEAFLKFRRYFESDGTAFELDVSGDERFVLMLDGEVISRGPHRSGSVENWSFQSYRVQVPAGKHRLEAFLWSAGAKGPREQLTYKTAFILKASGKYDKLLSTGAADWQVGVIGSTRMAGWGRSCTFGGGEETESTGAGVLTAEPKAWTRPVVVAGAMTEGIRWGVRRAGWLLYPSQLPDMLNIKRCPGKVVEGGALTGTIPANTKKRVLWDLENYYCGYPELKISGGKGAKVTWGWVESLKHGDSNETDRGKINKMPKRNRNEWQGKVFFGLNDYFISDGRAEATFTTPWWRCGRWCQLEIETKDEPLEIKSVNFYETRYPLSKDWAFESSDKSLDKVLEICQRGMEECLHETLFDCPFYEQQMYPGDGRVELDILASYTRDRRIPMRMIELFDFGRRNDGYIPMNYPCQLMQESATYSMCQVMMYRDLVRNGGYSAEWLKSKKAGWRATMAVLQNLENAEGLPVNLPGWTFIDWVDKWEHGEAPDGSVQNGRPSAVQCMFWVLTQQSAAVAERAIGDVGQAAYWEARAKRSFEAAMKLFYDEGRGLIADTVDHNCYSEHAQVLAMGTGLMDTVVEERVFKQMVAAEDLARASVYFTYYLFDAYFRHGRGDLFLKACDLWRGYVKLGLKTPLETPGESRSDCHAWGTHPITYCLRGLAGVKPAGEDGFKTVLVAPAPGDLKYIRAKVPHPNGAVEVDFKFDTGKAVGSVRLPAGTTGIYKFGGVEMALKPGLNEIKGE